MFDIITFGSATRDMFVASKDFKILEGGEFLTGKGICASAGSKIYIDDLVFATGGGGTNVAATFALQGLKTAYLGKVGNDPGGLAIASELREIGVEDLIIKDDTKKTAYSIILSAPSQERTILVYHGACHSLRSDEFDWNKIKAKWIYIAPLSGGSSEIFEPLINFARQNKIKIAVNPGDSQLKMNKEVLMSLLNKIDVLILNQEEAAQLTDLSYSDEKGIFKILDEMIDGIVVMSKGPRGVVASDGQYLYSAGVPESGLVDRTGAGDAFGSGFVAGLMQKGGDIEYAIQLGTANATSCVQHFGAKNGLLKKGEWGEWERVEVEKIESRIKNQEL